MTRKLNPTTSVLPVPGDHYDPHYMKRLISVLQWSLHNQENPSVVRGGWLNLSRVRYDAYSLVVGDVYIDGSTLKIVRVGDFGALGGGLATAVGTVTVTVV